MNISSLYSGVLAVAILILWSASLARTLSRPRSFSALGTELVFALLLALLITLKTTFALFGAVYFVGFFLLAFVVASDRRAVAASVLRTGLWAIAFAGPWLVLHASTITRARKIGHAFAPQAAAMTEPNSSMAAHSISRLFSVKEILYGGTSVAAYDFLLLICILGAMLALWQWRRHRLAGRANRLLAMVAAGFAMLTCYSLNLHLFYLGDAVRYSTPMLIGCFIPIVFGVLRFGFARKEQSYRRCAAAAVVVFVAVITLFAGNFQHRVALARRAHTILSFPFGADYIEHCEDQFSAIDSRYLRDIQSKMDSNTTVLVWVQMPSRLDAKRNRLLTVSEPGLMNPLIAFPVGIAPDALRQYLKQWGIRYVWVQNSGRGVKNLDYLKAQLTAPEAVLRRLATYAIYFRETLAVLQSQSNTLYSDNEMVLFDLGN